MNNLKYYEKKGWTIRMITEIMCVLDALFSQIFTEKKLLGLYMRNISLNYFLLHYSPSLELDHWKKVISIIQPNVVT